MKYVFIEAMLIGAAFLITVSDAHCQLVQPAPVVVQSEEAVIVDASTQVVNEIMAAPAQGIPLALLHDAKAIAICPGLLKGGFVIGVRHGRGVLVVRDESGGWRAPSFITMTGGSIGWQAGIQATDVILVFKTKKSVDGFMRGKFTIGGDVAATAGPVGREASAATDIQLKSEVYSYSRSRGLFAGAALDGSVVSLDNNATLAYYNGTGLLPGDGPPVQPPQLPASAANLLATIAAFSSPEPAAAAQPARVATQPLIVAEPAAPAAAAAQPADLEAIRGRLAASASRLSSRLDPSWQKYLALPGEIYRPQQIAPANAIAASLDHFNTVAGDPKYRPLSARAEFQETFGLLRAYRDVQAAGTSSTIALPPPPK
jgi:SH3 domain-containing YSC84-like protein 1